MAILGVIGLALLLLAVFGPQYWVKYIISKHSATRRDFPGTGGELAEHLLEKFEVEGVKVEVTDKGDHYDPKDRHVRLLKQHYDGSSISAVAIAAHEVGHAIQHHRNEAGFRFRQWLVSFLRVTDMIATIFFILAPVLTVIVRSPSAFLGLIVLGISFLAIRLIVHLATLPVEWDASFSKALPILEQGGYLQPSDMKAARQVLRAAASTYVAAALASLLDLSRWIRMIR